MALGKRYEIYLPIEYNPDEQGNRLPIEEEKFEQTYEELWQEFRGVTVMPESENQAFRGFWFDEFGELFRDKVVTAIVYATDINKSDSSFGKQLIFTRKGSNRKRF
ncbi:hypothetical protein FJZ31_13785 [Candidatus Poribacteria bacterium]|nr:hypothetical protein [Candidatus Poribacteria bacterium]